MKIYYHPASTTSRPVMLFAAENGIDALAWAPIDSVNAISQTSDGSPSKVTFAVVQSTDVAASGLLSLPIIRNMKS